MRLPATAWRAADTEAVLASRWTVGSADGRHLVWGLVAPDVATVAVTLSDGRTVSIPTVESGLPGLASRTVAGTLPEGQNVSGAEGRRADGTPVVRAGDVAASLAPVAGFDPAVTADVPLVAAG